MSRQTTPRVLIVEDDVAMAALLEEALEREGFRVSVAANGAAALATTERGAFDAIVLDREMPDADGLNLLAYFRHRAPSTPILLLTAFGGPLVAAAALRRGACRYFEKPVRLEQIVAAIRAALEHPGAGAAEGAVGPALAEIRSSGGQPPRGDLWAVVLAGGQGRRLAVLTRAIYGEPRPKQFAALHGPRTLLRRTLDRTTRRVPLDRTVVVGLAEHARHFEAELGSFTRPAVLLQPEDRGTAAAVLLAAHWVARRDPPAVVAVFPSDHAVRGEETFVRHVAALADFVDGTPERIVIVGAPPTSPETDYGWVEPDRELALTGAGPVWSVRRFVEKPTPEGAQACLDAGALWSTFVLVARAAALIDAGRQLLRRFHDGVADLAALGGPEVSARALRPAYAAIPHASFSSAILELCAPILAVSRLSGVAWHDLGTPARLVGSLQAAGLRPPWLRGGERSP